MFSTSAFDRCTISFDELSTSVVNTIGRRPSSDTASLIFSTVAYALSLESTNGTRTRRNFWSNWDRIECAKVSAVIPVPSETMNTVGGINRARNVRKKSQRGQQREQLRGGAPFEAQFSSGRHTSTVGTVE